MYSKTAKSAHYLPRTGSYSTVPKRNGRVDVLPPEAKEQIYDDKQDKRSILLGRLSASQKRLGEINRLIRDKHGAELDEHGYAIRHRKNDGSQTTVSSIKQLSEELRSLLDERRATVGTVRQLESQLSNTPKKSSTDFCQCFVDVAEELLDSDAFARIKAETRQRLMVR